jgi:predicted membrane chloride channel (bestrophin family)
MNAGMGDTVHWTADVIGGLIVVLQSIFVLGLRILGQKMNDPYGDDLIDLSVMFFVEFTWTMSNRILKSQFPGEASDEEEKSLERKRQSIGDAWEDHDRMIP